MGKWFDSFQVSTLDGKMFTLEQNAIEMEKKPVFVTGGTGLLGSHLIYTLLLKGEKVIATCRKTSKRDIVEKVASYYSGNWNELRNNLLWIECDLFNYEALRDSMKGIRHVYHCAATVSFVKGETDSILKNNITGTSNIVKSCLENKVEKLCHVSSVAALGAENGELLVNEDKGWNDKKNLPDYWVSKHLSEMEVWKGIENGLNAVIVNPTIILGPGDWNRSSSALFKGIANGLIFYTDGIKAYVDVNDVVKAMILLIESNISGEKFIVNSENLTNREFFRMVAGKMGVIKPFIKIPWLLSPVAFLVADFIQLATRKRSPLTRDILKAAWTKVGYDNRKIISRTGITFLPIESSVEKIASIYNSEKGRR
jgi:nucleoside-diphosphate-sugar epimerase